VAAALSKQYARVGDDLATETQVMTEKIPDKNVSFAEEEVTRDRNFVRANRCSFSEHMLLSKG
jgi:hypothetical protein